MNPADPRLVALQRYTDGLASAEDVALIEETVLQDAEFRALVVEYLHIDSSMEEFAVVAEELPAPRPRRLAWRFAAAAAVVVAACLAFWLVKGGGRPGAAVEIVSLTKAALAEPNNQMQAGDRVRGKELRLQSGEAELRLASGVKMVLAGPAEIRFIDAMHARLARGKVTLDCGAGGQGFVLDTPAARVVDVSTQFGVEARADGTSDVMVIKGSVKLFDSGEAGKAAPLEQGEAVRVDAAHGLQRITNITGGPQPAEWSTLPPSGDCNIAAVSDTFGAGQGFHFYRTVPHGLRPGAMVYTNRSYVWRAAPGQAFPPSLLEADVVQTFFGELLHPGYAIEVTVARPVDLFVLMPRRGLPQPWLAEGFARTGDEVVLDEAGPSERKRPPLIFEVWKRRVVQAGKVTLGPGNRDSQGRPVGMYGIAARSF